MTTWPISAVSLLELDQAEFPWPCPTRSRHGSLHLIQVLVGWGVHGYFEGLEAWMRYPETCWFRLAFRRPENAAPIVESHDDEIENVALGWSGSC